MKLLLNILWLIFGGLITAIIWFLLGILLCITIIGIPFGLQAFKVSKLVLAPFGKDIDLNPDKYLIINVLWLIFFGWAIALTQLLYAAAFAITIIGIPLAFQWLKFAKLALFPFGAKIK